jgi:D-ribose pyranase
MKRRGILNAQLSHLIARLGHRDLLAVADCGLPIPEGVERVDLALVPGVPSFGEVLQALADEIVVETVYVAEETRARNQACYDLLRQQFPEVEWKEIPHEELKRLLLQTKGVIRTGEATPYANAILVCGVAF